VSYDSPKGVSQYDYFSKNGTRVKLLGIAKHFGNIFDIFNLVKTVSEDLDTSQPLPLNFGPLSPVADFLGAAVQQQKAEDDLYFQEEWKEEIDLLKLEGLDAVRQFVDSLSHVDLFEWRLINISGETATKLIFGEFETFMEMRVFEDNLDFSDPSKISLLYRIIEDQDRGGDIYVIESIFIDE